MNKDRSGYELLFDFVLAPAGMLAFAIWMIGADTMRLLAKVFVACLCVALIMMAVAFPIRMWKKKDALPQVEHYYHDGTRVERTIEGGRTTQPVLYQMPNMREQPMFPELLRAASGAGLQRQLPAEPVEPTQTYPPADENDWQGQMRR
jgi:hypothetical protein